MALLPTTTFEIVASDGDVAQFVDTTGAYATNNTGGYGSPNIAYAAVSGVNLLIGNYLSLTSTNTLGEDDELTEYVQYIKTAGAASTYDNKTISVGELLVPHTTGLTVLAGDEFEETGFYNPLITAARWLPTAAQTPLYLDGDDLGLNTTGVIPDTVITITYSVYGNAQTSSFTSTSGVSYLITGDKLITYNGNTYRQGEVFEAIDASTVSSTGSGTFGVSVYQGGNYNAYITAYTATSDITALTVSNINNPRPQQQAFQAQLALINANIAAINRQATLGLVSYTQAYDWLQMCISMTNNLSNGVSAW